MSARQGGVLGLLMAAGLLGAAPVVAQTGGSGTGYSDGGGEAWVAPRSGPGWAATRAGQPLAAADVDRVVARVNDIAEYCAWFGRGYEVDCLRDQYSQMRAWLPQTAAYTPLRQALWQAERELGAVVQQFSDPRAGRARARAQGNPTSLRAGRGLIGTPGRQATAAARAVIERTETVLLRSVSAQDPRRLAFQRMAQAFDSTKVLLRSRA